MFPAVPYHCRGSAKTLFGRCPGGGRRRNSASGVARLHGVVRGGGWAASRHGSTPRHRGRGVGQQRNPPWRCPLRRTGIEQRSARHSNRNGRRRRALRSKLDSNSGLRGTKSRNWRRRGACTRAFVVRIVRVPTRRRPQRRRRAATPSALLRETICMSHGNAAKKQITQVSRPSFRQAAPDVRAPSQIRKGYGRVRKA